MKDEYAAFFKPRTHKFETIDFRVPATPFNVRTYFPQTTAQSQTNGRVAGLLGLAVGFFVALVGFGIDQLQRGLTLGLYRATSSLLSPGSSFWPAFVVFLIISLVFALIPTLAVVYYAPLGAGSGIPELKAYLNGVRVPGFLSIHSLIVKAAGIACSISSGLILGKQGPVVHAGAIVGAAVSQAASTTFHSRLKFPFFRFFRTEAWKRDFTAVGAAVGVAVAFGAPMGGWMWVYEEACTHWSWELGIITLVACMSGTGISRILNYLASGLPGGGFGNFTFTQFGKLVTPFSGSVFPLKDLPGFVFVGCVGGAVGALLPLLNKQITLFRYRHVTTPPSRIAETTLILLITATIKFIIPYIASKNGGCVSVGVPGSGELDDRTLQQVLLNAPLGDFSSFICPDGQFSPWAAAMYNPTDSIARGLLFDSTGLAYPAAPVAVATVFFVVFTVWTYGIAVPAGVFFPAFLVGSVYGRLIGIAVQEIFPARPDVSLTGYAFLGSVSALAGITRTISVAVVALEATGGNSAFFATVLVALISKLVADFLYQKGIYDLHIDLKDMPFLSNAVPNLERFSKVRVQRVMRSSVIGVGRRSRFAELVYMLKHNTHHAFPVFLKVEAGQEMQSSTSEGSRSASGCVASMSTPAIGGLSYSADDDNMGDEEDGTRLEISKVTESKSTSHMVVSIKDPVATEIDSGDVLKGRPPTSTNDNVEEDDDDDDDDDDGGCGVDGSEPTTTKPKARSTIMTPTAAGMRATIYDEGRKRIVHLPSSGYSGMPGVSSSAFITDVGQIDSSGSASAATAEQLQGKGKDVSRDMDVETLDYQLIGMIDRGTLLMLMKHEIERKGLHDNIQREHLDAAWPNPSRCKGDQERLLLDTLQQAGQAVLDTIIDLKEFIDPDPLLISQRAHCMSAYRTLRRTGARHILVANMRSGRVCGILTRKDVLPQSVDEVVGQRRGKAHLELV